MFILRGLVFCFICEKAVGFGEEPENQVFLSTNNQTSKAKFIKKQKFFGHCAAFGTEMFLSFKNQF